MEALQAKISSLANTTTRDELLATSKNLTVILDHKSESWNPVSKSIYEKSKTFLLPKTESKLKSASGKLKDTFGTKAASRIIATFIYGLTIAILVVSFLLFRNFQVSCTTPSSSLCVVTTTALSLVSTLELLHGDTLFSCPLLTRPVYVSIVSLTLVGVLFLLFLPTPLFLSAAWT